MWSAELLALDDPWLWTTSLEGRVSILLLAEAAKGLCLDLSRSPLDCTTEILPALISTAVSPVVL